MGASEDKAFSQESVSEQATSRFSAKSFALIALACIIAAALTVLAVINNSGLATIADNPNPMASGEVEDIDEPKMGEKYDWEEPMVGSSDVAYYAMEGGTLVFDPDDDASVGVKCDPICIDEDGNVIEISTGSSSQFGPNAKKGLKEYVTSVAVNPTVCYGSITAVPDPGYEFVSWNNGVNYSSKLYLWGAMSGTATAYFEKIPVKMEVGEEIKSEESGLGGQDKIAFYATEGGTLTHDPSDHYDMKADDSGTANSNAKTGLKEYQRTIAVTPYASGGSITAVPDPGYVFVKWVWGKCESTSAKQYIQGACGAYTKTAYFEKATPAAGIADTDDELIIGGHPTTTTDPYASLDEPETDIVIPAPAMSVYAHNALNGSVSLAQGKSTSLDGFAVLAEDDYAGNVSGKVRYASSNKNIATVDESGKVTASKKKTGTAKITIFSADNPSCKKVVTVKVVKKAKFIAPKKITKLNLNKQYKANAKKQIAVKVLGWDPKSPSDKNFTVSVSPAKKASVDPTTNKITFKAKGTVKVTVKSTANPKVSKTVSVKVK